MGLGSQKGFGSRVGRSGDRHHVQMLAPAGGSIGKLAEEFHALGGRKTRWAELSAEHGSVRRFLQRHRLTPRALKEEIRSEEMAEEPFITGRHMAQRGGKNDGILLRRGFNLDFTPLWCGEAAG